MTENMQADSVQSRQAGFVRCCHNEIQLLCFDDRVNYHTSKNMQSTIKGNHFGSAYFCRNLLPTKLEMRQLVKYDRPLVTPTIGGDE